MPQADTEHRHPAQELLNLLNLEDILRRVPRAIGEHDPVGACRQNLLRRRCRRQDRNGAAPVLKLPDNVALGAIVQQRDPEPLLPRRRVYGGLPAGDGLHHAGDSVGLHRREVRRNPAANRGVHHAMFPDDSCELPGVHAAQPRHILLLQIGVQVTVTPEIRGGIAVLPHHIALDAAGALKILTNDPIVADQRIGLQHDLPRIAGVRQRLNITAHAGGEHQLPHRVSPGAKAKALKHLAVLEHQIALFHSCPPAA